MGDACASVAQCDREVLASVNKRAQKTWLMSGGLLVSGQVFVEGAAGDLEGGDSLGVGEVLQMSAGLGIDPECQVRGVLGLPDHGRPARAPFGLDLLVDLQGAPMLPRYQRPLRSSRSLPAPRRGPSPKVYGEFAVDYQSGGLP